KKPDRPRAMSPPGTLGFFGPPTFLCPAAPTERAGCTLQSAGWIFPSDEVAPAMRHPIPTPNEGYSRVFRGTVAHVRQLPARKTRPSPRDVAPAGDARLFRPSD